MVAQPHENGVLPGKDALAAAFDWWREAGIDLDYDDTPSQWLKVEETDEAVTSPPVTMPKEPPRRNALERTLDADGAAGIGGTEAEWPQDLPAFRDWWLSEKSLSDTSGENRIAPTGDSGAELAVLTPFPLPESERAFLIAILRAFGWVEAETYRASALPAAISLPDWQELGERGLAAVTHHHMTLAKPRRLLVLDRGLSSLFGIAPGNARTPATLKLTTGAVPMLFAPALADLARSPERRKSFWTRLLEWTA